MAVSETYNIGPAAIGEPGVSGGPPFALSKTEWVTIQTYVDDALVLPTTEAEFRKSLGEGAPKDLADFLKLIAAYKAINEHCMAWKSSAFPHTVALANTVYEYGTHKAPAYYPAILKEAEVLEKDPNNEPAKNALQVILGKLETDAGSYATEAEAVTAEVQKFADATLKDKTELQGGPGVEGLMPYYAREYGEKSKVAQAIPQKIQELKRELEHAEAEYRHDVIVASTTPTYAWVPIAGWIAGGVVAGIYGHRAVEELRKVHALEAQIAELQAIERAEVSLMLAITAAERGMVAIAKALSEALPVIQKIQGVWAALAADVRAILKIIDEDIAQAPAIIMGLGVEEAEKAWYNVALAADGYRKNAYVREVSAAGEGVLAWKVAHHISSPAALAA
jgi:hypothetical protein